MPESAYNWNKKRSNLYLTCTEWDTLSHVHGYTEGKESVIF